jgi:hypothetical protein
VTDAPGLLTPLEEVGNRQAIALSAAPSTAPIRPTSMMPGPSIVIAIDGGFVCVKF